MELWICGEGVRVEERVRTYPVSGTQDVVGEESIGGWFAWVLVDALDDGMGTGAIVEVEFEPEDR